MYEPIVQLCQAARACALGGSTHEANQIEAVEALNGGTRGMTAQQRSMPPQVAGAPARRTHEAAAETAEEMKERGERRQKQRLWQITKDMKEVKATAEPTKERKQMKTTAEGVKTTAGEMKWRRKV